MRHLFLSFVLATACGAAPTSTDAQAKAPAAAAAPAPSADASGIAATINGEPITIAEVEAAAGAEIMQKQQELYEIRMGALEQLLAEKLFAAEAAKRGTDEAGLLKAEVEDKAQAPQEAEILALYEQSKPRLGDTPLDEVRPKIEGFLQQRNRGVQMQSFISELKKAAKVEIKLDAPRFQVEVPATAPVKGPSTAPITIVEFSDFECPYCSRAAETVDQVVEKYGDKVRIVFRNFPLDFHANARKAAEASLCANEEGKFWEYHDKLFANQRALAVDDLVGYAKEIGLAEDAFSACLSSGKHATTVATDMAAGQASGVQGTPGFFVNGRFLGGAQPVEEFSKLIDQELARNGAL